MKLIIHKSMVLLILSIFLPGSTLSAQNLVANGSFEKVNFLNKGAMWKSLNGEQFTKMSIHWQSTYSSSPDYIVFGNDKTYAFKEYNTKVQNYKPVDGEKAVGISVYGCHRKSGACREYLQAQLIEPLIKGEKYYVEFWVSRIRNGAMINKLGAYFSEELPDDIHIEKNGNIPQVLEEKLIGEKAFKWQKIAGEFTADKAYKFITIGNLYPDEDTNLLENEKRNTLTAYYFLDQVQVVQLDKKLNETDLSWSNVEPGKTYILDKILFEFGKAVFLETSFEELNKLLALLNEQPAISVEITGHTDNIGKENFNLNLSQARAHSIKDFLIEKGIASHRIRANGVGAIQPRADNSTEEGRRLNRRVELRLMSEKKTSKEE